MKQIVRYLRWKYAAGPALFAVVSIALLVYDHLNRRVTEILFWLTLALIVAVFTRMIDTVRKQHGALERHSINAFRDPVTGLRNRRCLGPDIEGALAKPGNDWLLVLLELDGLQTYYDSFGDTSGDELLRRISQQLVDAVAALGGIAYRIDARRLSVLVPAGDRQLGEMVLSAATSLRNDDGDLLIGRSFGEVRVPGDTDNAELALRIAGQRLAAHKQRQHRSARRQAHAVLMAALDARRPALRDHLRVVAYRAISLARRLGLEREEIDDVTLAAELQDVGLLAIPESVLEKETPLDKGEKAMVRSHPVEGERIISAAPGLTTVAHLVRSSAEHFDGSGYPDGLSGNAIPLGSRVIAVSVAFAAMTSPRPYRAASDPWQALVELRRCAGTQFDPVVVDALATELAEEAAPAAPAPA
jgi:GGDEF domain-containing protein